METCRGIVALVVQSFTEGSVVGVWGPGGGWSRVRSSGFTVSIA